MRIGVDLGGTKIEAIALDRDGGELWRRRIPTPAGDYDGTLAAIARLVDDAESALDCRGSVGIATPGSISPTTGLLRNSNSTVLNGRPLDRDLVRLLNRQVRTANDANCFAVSEATDGAGRGAAVMFGVILGTGVGGGIVVGGRPLSGHNRIAGEWGHNPLPWPTAAETPGPACWCGQHGCIETFLSGPGFAAEMQRSFGLRMLPEEIVAAAEAGDEPARHCLAVYTDRLARALASVVNLLDPEVVVLGGGLSNIPRLAAATESALARHVFADRVATPVRPAVHGDSSGVRGAAWLWPAEADPTMPA